MGYCLDPTDLFLSKAAAGREKDRVFCTAMLVHRYVVVEDALRRLPDMPVSQAELKRLQATVRRWAKAAAPDDPASDTVRHG